MGSFLPAPPDARLRILTDSLRAFAEAAGDYDRLLDEVARRLATVVADGCVVRLLDANGRLAPVAEAGVRETEAARSVSLVQQPLDPRDHAAIRRVIETGEPMLLPHVDLAQVRAAATPEIARVYEAMGLHSLLVVALRARGRSIGSLALLRFLPGSAPFDDRDRELAQTLADHAALAIDNERLARAGRAEVERKLREEHALYETVLAALSDLGNGVSITEGERFVYANEALARTYGRSVAELLALPSFYDLLAPEERERIARRRSVRVTDGASAPTTGETTILHTGGRHVPVEYASKALDPSAPLRLFTVTRDITERRLAQEAIAKRDRDFHRLIESFADPVFVHRDGTIVYVNPAFVAWWGGDGPESLVGRSVFDVLVHPDEHERIRERLRAVTEARGDLLFEVRCLRRDGSARTIQSTGVRVEFEGAPAHVVVARDITESREAQRRLALSDRMASLGTLAAGIAHEINNPLGYVTANLELLAEALAGGAPPPSRPLDGLVADARQGADRVRRIVRGLRAFSHGDEERRVRLDVRAVLAAAVELTHNEVRHRARLVKEYGPVPQVEADEGRLGQVFINLLANAAQAIDVGHAERNEIRLTTSTDAAGRAVIEVRDTGRGIPAEALPRVFDPFFTTKAVGEGTGLGLAICHGIVSALGGEITVRSDPGRGSSFRVVLPRARATASLPKMRAASSRPPSKSPPAVGKRGHVLVVDDDPLVSAAMRRMLSPHHEVIIAGDGQAAIDLLLEGKWFDVILCDLMMPTVSGIEVYTRVAAALPEMLDRIVFVTGGAFTPAAREFLDGVPNELLEKPVPREQLLQVVASFLG